MCGKIILLIVFLYICNIICQERVRQSPINIITKNVAKPAKYAPLKWNNYENEAFEATLTTNDITAIVNGYKWENKPMILTGGPLTTEYLLDNVHWHWGANNSVGSEHFLNGKQYPIEMHMVTYKTNFKSLIEALASGDPEAISIVANFVEISTTSEIDFPIIRKAIQKYKGEKPYDVTLDYRFFGPSVINQYYRYLGSFTTFPQPEVVQWLVSTQVLKFTQKQLDALRTVTHNGKSLNNNFRALQPLNNRTVTFYRK